MSGEPSVVEQDRKRYQRERTSFADVSSSCNYSSMKVVCCVREVCIRCSLQMSRGLKQWREEQQGMNRYNQQY